MTTSKVAEVVAIGMRQSDRYTAETILDIDDSQLPFDEVRRSIPFPE